MYAFRKPFAAATYEDDQIIFWGQEFDSKALFVISQIIGYALSKLLGIKVCSETGHNNRYRLLISLILAAEAALFLFAVSPQSMPYLRVFAIFANGLPLGMVWGLVVLYLEGRRMSEVLLTGLSCAYIVSSGIVKDIGRAILAGDAIPLPAPESWAWTLPNPFPPMSDYWMPFATGLLFLPPFLLATWLLEQLPKPTQNDIAERVERRPMERKDRHRFLRKYGVGVLLALIAYFFLTAFRDYRDNYAVEIFSQLGYDYASNKTVVSRSELLVAFGVMAILSQLYRVRDNRLGLIVTYGVMTFGLALIGVVTLLLDRGLIDGFWWLTFVGFGAYLAYVPFGSVLFDRVIAMTGFTGTAVFGIYLADTVGYSGSIGMQLIEDQILREQSELNFLRGMAYLVSIVGTLGLASSSVLFLIRRESN